MICKALRNLVWVQVALILAIGAALVGGLMKPPPAWPESETHSLTLRAPELPLTALVGNPAVRIEKQAQSLRPTLHKPGQGARLSVVIREHKLRPRSQTARAFRGFPRRQLHPGHAKPHSADDPSTPLLS